MKSPYSSSNIISKVIFDFNSVETWAVGSDNWPVTWADDNHQYSAWGDGGGFGGTNSDGRVSLGVARIEGDRNSFKGFNVWGGKNPETKATFKGKSYGVVCIAGNLYMWVSPGSGMENLISQTVFKSSDHGHTWERGNWSFHKHQSILHPTFLQFNKNYEGARGNYAYIYSIRLKGDRIGKSQAPGQMIDLMRVKKDRIMNRSAYEFFAGLSKSDSPTWSSNINLRQPVFEDPNGVG